MVGILADGDTLFFHPSMLFISRNVVYREFTFCEQSHLSGDL
jgi:hypothetical protein